MFGSSVVSYSQLMPIGVSDTPYNGDVYHPRKIMVGSNLQPQNFLHINNNSAGANSTAYLQITNYHMTSSGLIGSDNGLKIGLNGEDNGLAAIISQQENSFLKFATNATDRAIIAADGKVGIGIMTPQSELHVHGTRTIGGSIDNDLGSPRKSKYQKNNQEADKFLGIGMVSTFGLTAPKDYAAIQLTNNTIGVNTSDGLLLEVIGNDAVINLKEQGSISFRNSASVSLYIDKYNNVGIGTTNPNGYKLAVKGTAHFVKVVVNTHDWSDFIFENDYKPIGLYQLENYIQTHKHLPDIPSESEVKKNGIDVAQMNKLLLQKIEELTLYLIDLQKQIDELKKEKNNR